MNESEFRYVDDPTVAIDGSGRVVVAWANQVDQDVFVQAYDPAGAAIFDAPVNVSRSPDIFSWLPRVSAPDGEPGRVYVAWQEIVFSDGSHGGEIFFARSTDGGRSFGTPVNLSRTSAGAGKGRLSFDHWDNGSLDLAVGAGGDVHVAWSEHEGALRYRRSLDGGVTFAETVHVAGDSTASTRGPTLALGGGGVVHLGWTTGEDPAADVRLATSADGGLTFGAPAVVATSDGHADAPKLVVDNDGTLHCAFAEAPRMSPGRSTIQYTRRPAGQQRFETPRAISPGDTSDVHHVGFPSLAVDRDSNLYVVWERFETDEDRPFGLGFAYSSDAGRTFGLHAVVPGTADPTLGVNGGLQGLLMRKVAVGVDGGIAVVNSSFAAGEVSRIRLIRGRVDGPIEPSPWFEG
jgi:hypothetical protein